VVLVGAVAFSKRQSGTIATSEPAAERAPAATH
jgi:hypothetical protein